MDTNTHAMKLKLAWQQAWRERSCPGDDLLFAEPLSEEVTRHLRMCPSCHDLRNSTAATRSAWRELFGNLYAGLSAHRATSVEPVEGQIWALRDDLSHWGSDGNYYHPPHVLLLHVDGNALTVAQTYHDLTLAGDGDVVLSEPIVGFAESWNIYTIHREMLAHCRGAVKSIEVQAVLHEAEQSRADLDENSILYWFRTTEAQVGAEIAVPSVAALMEEMGAPLELIPGLKLAFSGTRDFVLDIATETLEMLRGTFKPAMVLRGGISKPVAAKLSDNLKKLIHDHCPVIPVDVKVAGNTLNITLKWLRNKPEELPKVYLNLYGAVFTSAILDLIDSENISFTHDSIYLINTAQIYELNFKYSGEILSLVVTFKKS